MTGRRLLFALAVVTLQGLGACGDGGTGVDTRAPRSVAVLDGDGQEVLRGGALPEPLRVRVTNRDGEPLAGVRVAWWATGGTLSASESQTDASGIASVSWAMLNASGTVPVGPRQATATVTGLNPAIFTGYSRRGLELMSVTFGPGQVNVASGPAQVTVTVRATTDIGDVTEGSLRFNGPAELGLQNTRVSLTSGTAKDGEWQATVQIPQGAPAGAWGLQVRMRSTLQDITWFHSAAATNGLQNLLTVTNQ